MAFDWEVTVKKLLAKANAEGVTEKEKEALENKAFELMARYNVAITLKEDNIRDAIYYEITFTGVYTQRQAALMNIISKHYDCRLLQIKGDRYELFGFERDLEQVNFLYSILEPQMFAGLARTVIPVDVHAKTYRTSWLNGFVMRIGERLDAAKKVAQSQSQPGYAVALRNKEVIVDQTLRNRHSRVTTKHSYYGDRQAFGFGRDAGSNARFSANKETGNGGGRALGRGSS
jgi:hypothetical protein